MLTETWLREHLDAEINIKSYSVFRTDRNRLKKRRGRNSGGVAVYIREDIAASCEVLFQFSSGVIEALCISVKRLNLVTCVIYRPPDEPQGGNCSRATEFFELIGKLTETLNELQTPTPNIIIAGDFNLPKTNWSTCTPRSGATAVERDITHLLSNFMNEFFLHQTVVGSTHRAGNLLDLILTNDPNSIITHEISPIAPVSSHHLIMCQTTLSCPQAGLLVLLKKTKNQWFL